MLRDDDEIKLQYLLVRIVPYQAFFEGGHPLENRGLGSTLRFRYKNHQNEPRSLATKSILQRYVQVNP